MNGDGTDRDLARMRLLKNADESEIRRVQRLCRWRPYRKGQTVIEAESASGEVYFVAEGRVNVLNLTPAGREVVFASLGPGESFGELAAIDGGPRSATIVAAEESLIAELSSQHFLTLLERQPGVALGSGPPPTPRSSAVGPSRLPPICCPGFSPKIAWRSSSSTSSQW